MVAAGEVVLFGGGPLGDHVLGPAMPEGANTALLVLPEIKHDRQLRRCADLTRVGANVVAVVDVTAKQVPPADTDFVFIEGGETTELHHALAAPTWTSWLTSARHEIVIAGTSAGAVVLGAGERYYWADGNDGPTHHFLDLLGGWVVFPHYRPAAEGWLRATCDALNSNGGIGVPEGSAVVVSATNDLCWLSGEQAPAAVAASAATVVARC